ncbi:MAG: hypothetical protein FP825_18780 [Hyphomonas sp.]|uniref:hypothetical protein n=1 Tax=Hyphomonas sp. TaxID=87 RepID=UPI0017F529E7|nr:hypothetical protein [Hyphomonas sp.]MBU3920055.1 hypothetical protein [Alphaproteobacteria bacterium]MBA3070509.1 hypothetical protein [Hyphomonas sp.]MBU4062039.1 hypothetical protein [Alphaproteobacteria bacterium]MBU4164975.1 hypothetical protein [Alphaproteobacteria bacterium]MBU4568621.1 hypothetical protein [Alphaproteobacteria bacterium]
MEKLIPKFETMDDINKALRTAGICGLVVAAMTLLGLLFVLFGGDIAAEDKLGSMIGIGAELLLILLFTWRFSMHRGVVSGVLLLALFLLETFLKIVSGTTSVAWIFVYAALILGIVNGLRACFAYKRIAPGMLVADTF